MTQLQEYLARDLTDEDIAYCQKAADTLERNMPWADQECVFDPSIDPQNTSWLDVVMRDQVYWNNAHRAAYCAEMEGLQ